MTSFSEIPSWVLPLVTSVLSAIGTALAAILSYRNQKHKIMQELEETRKSVRELDITEFREISQGNKTLRDALLERLAAEEREREKMQMLHRECERRLFEAEKELRRLGGRLDFLEVLSKKNDPEAYGD